MKTQICFLLVLAMAGGSPGIPAAQAGEATRTLTPEQIEHLYRAEMKVAGKTLRCFQAGVEVLYEVGLRDVREGKDRISALRLDGTVLDVILSGDMGGGLVTRRGGDGK